TTTTMIAHIFHTAQKPFLAFLGGISKNFGTNFFQSAVGSGQAPPHQGATCIVEADEFDRSFLHLSPDIAIITSMDADHLDIYTHKNRMKKSFAEFATRIRNNGSLIIKDGIELDCEFTDGITVYRYNLTGKTGFHAANIEIRNGLIHFDFITPSGKLPGFVLGIPGMFNLENAIAALAAGWLSGIPEIELRCAMHHFSGVVRRFDLRIRRDDFVYIDDYAHHPEELHACIRAVRELYPGKRITGVFQPHLYSRTRDLADDFVRVLAELDALILLDIYPAREQPVEGIHSRMLLERIHLSDKMLCDKEELLDILEAHRPEVLLTLGAGDIDQLVQPITERFGPSQKTKPPDTTEENWGMKP
ncbi:MAG: UDP-N-acetylmuramate--L-alanine ligase, partial [Bacteroidales bacterium]|nr:UDP-N-acetylmuramate--L-alanine ligase [Bacteroidales bacterium]